MFYKKQFQFALTLILAGCASAFAQQVTTSPTPPPQSEDQEPVKVFTEEVRLPVLAMDQYGHYDPTVVPEDILVLEDGTAQQIQSVRRIPANVVLVLDTGGESSGLGGQSKRPSLTREVAIELLNRMKPETWISVVQFNNTVDTIQPWTNEKQLAVKAIKTKLSSGKRSRFSDAIAAAAAQLADRPEGSRHVVLITDGVDSGAKIDKTEAIKRLMAVRATIHIVSYTEYVRQKKESASNTRGQQMPTSSDPITSTDPTLPPGTTRSPSYRMGSITFDPEMKRQRKAYEAEVKKSQQAMTSMADETGGRIYLPKTADDMLDETKEIAQEIGAEYIVSYRPKRPLAQSKQGEYRKVEVASRRVGLTLRSRRGYVIPQLVN